MARQRSAPSNQKREYCFERVPRLTASGVAGRSVSAAAEAPDVVVGASFSPPACCCCCCCLRCCCSSVSDLLLESLLEEDEEEDEEAGDGDGRPLVVLPVSIEGVGGGLAGRGGGNLVSAGAGAGASPARWTSWFAGVGTEGEFE